MFKQMTGVLDQKALTKFSEEDILKIPSYIFCRWLSGNVYTNGAANMINMYHDIPIDNQYKMIHYAFAGKIKFIPYPKQQTENLDMLKNLCTFFNISEEEAKRYLEFISKEELDNINNMYLKR